MQKTDQNTLQIPAPLWRHAIAMVYDTFLLSAALMLATLPVVTFFDGVPGGWARHAFQFYLVTVIFLFFGWFWVHGGQTLGMRSWRLQLIDAKGTSVGWKTAFLRFVVAIFSGLAAGLGYWWVLLDKKNRTWHDHASDSYIILLSKKKVL